jgi:DNA-binding response OmpR family regulator
MLCFHQMPVVICESVLPDGNWIDILSETAPLMDSPRLIVASNHADAPDDRLRARVLNLGGFDVVSKPFDRNEVIRVVTVAWRNWEKDWSSHATYALPLTA